MDNKREKPGNACIGASAMNAITTGNAYCATFYCRVHNNHGYCYICDWKDRFTT